MSRANPRYQRPFQKLPAGVQAEVQRHLAAGLSHRQIVTAMDHRVSTATVSRIMNLEPLPLSPVALSFEIVAAPATDPRQLYLLEKAKRAERKRPEMEAARRAFDALLAAEKEAGKGGRPRKAPFIAPRSVDLADHLPKFTHRHASDRR